MVELQLAVPKNLAGHHVLDTRPQISFLEIYISKGEKRKLHARSCTKEAVKHQHLQNLNYEPTAKPSE